MIQDTPKQRAKYTKTGPPSLFPTTGIVAMSGTSGSMAIHARSDIPDLSDAARQRERCNHSLPIAFDGISSMLAH